MSKIQIKNVYKIFGENPSKVLPMVQDGATKEEVLEKGDDVPEFIEKKVKSVG